MAKPVKPLLVIELITLLVIAGLIVAITLPRCQHREAPVSTPATAPSAPVPV